MRVASCVGGTELVVPREILESHGRLLLSDENRRMDRGGRKSELERKTWLGWQLRFTPR